MLPPHQHNSNSLGHRKCIDLAQELGLSAIMPLTSLSMMFMSWDGEHTDEATLSDSDDGGVRMMMERTPQDTSQRRSTISTLPSAHFARSSPSDTSLRCINKITNHYSKLGVSTIFARCPRLKAHLKDEYDETFIHEVCP